MKTAAQVIAEVLFCDYGIGENTSPNQDGNKSDEIARAILAALESAGFLMVHIEAAQ